MERREAVAGAQTVARAVNLLKHLARAGDQGLRLVDLADETQLARPTLHRLLKALCIQGLVTQERQSRRYRLGALVFELGLAAAHRFNLRELSIPVLETLSRRSGDTSFLFVRSGDDVVCINRVQGDFPIQTPALPLGSRQPLGVNAGGLALLSHLPTQEQEQLIKELAPRLEAYGEMSINELRQYCRNTRERGYAWIANRAVPGIAAVGLPIFSANGIAIAAVTVASTQSRMTEARSTTILPFLRMASTEISGLLRQ
ncbi:IclR family transcriptional regulator [Chromobacterium sp. Panama]|nr:IclR family transcriptional regulator [Chromobacterium sp. Panama]